MGKGLGSQPVCSGGWCVFGTLFYVRANTGLLQWIEGPIVDPGGWDHDHRARNLLLRARLNGAKSRTRCETWSLTRMDHGHASSVTVRTPIFCPASQTKTSVDQATHPPRVGSAHGSWQSVLHGLRHRSDYPAKSRRWSHHLLSRCRRRNSNLAASARMPATKDLASHAKPRTL